MEEIYCVVGIGVELLVGYDACLVDCHICLSLYKDTRDKGLDICIFMLDGIWMSL